MFYMLDYDDADADVSLHFGKIFINNLYHAFSLRRHIHKPEIYEWTMESRVFSSPEFAKCSTRYHIMRSIYVRIKLNVICLATQIYTYK